jgi:hypothetical protein
MSDTEARQRQRARWATGDFADIASTLHAPAEYLLTVATR